jgi:hypothetical protein
MADAPKRDAILISCVRDNVAPNGGTARFEWNSAGWLTHPGNVRAGVKQVVQLTGFRIEPLVAALLKQEAAAAKKSKK